MNYVYNIKVNLKRKLYNFYEWKSSDKIETIDKLKVFVVNDEIYDNVLKMCIKVKKDFLDSILLNKSTCIFTNDIDTVCVRFNKNGIIDLISKLDLEEEMEVLDEIDLKNKYNLEYTIIDNKNNYSYNTRDEEKIINSLNKYINNNKDNDELIDYLYNEWFNDEKTNNKLDKLLSSINENFSKKHEDLYKLIKIIA